MFSKTKMQMTGIPKKVKLYMRRTGGAFLLKNTFQKLIILLPLVIPGLNSPAQFQSSKERRLVREGNALYDKKKFSDAETQYRKSLEESKTSATSTFNLGDALYKQNKFPEAASQFQQLSQGKADKKTLSQAYHNLGNSLLKAEKYEESVNAFKQSLINNPNDSDTRYNLAYAMSKLKAQQQQQQNKDNKDNKDDKNKDKNNKDNRQKNKDQKENDKKNKNEQQQNQQQQDKSQAQQQQKPKISKEDAERILAALKNDEKNLQKRMQKKEASRGKTDKNW